jgi:hypothetical protein
MQVGSPAPQEFRGLPRSLSGGPLPPRPVLSKEFDQRRPIKAKNVVCGLAPGFRRLTFELFQEGRN